MSKNTFSISGDKIYITRPEWNYMACATVRDDYAEEIQNATWGLNNERYGHGVCIMHRIAPLKNWTKDVREKYFIITDVAGGARYQIEL